MYANESLNKASKQATGGGGHAQHSNRRAALRSMNYEEGRDHLSPKPQMTDSRANGQGMGMYRAEQVQLHMAGNNNLNSQQGQGLQLLADESQPPLDFDSIAQNIYDAMNGMGTDEGKIMGNLARLNNDSSNIRTLETTYLSKFGMDLKAHLRSELSNNILGNELDIALGYLIASESSSSNETESASNDAIGTGNQSETETQGVVIDQEALTEETQGSILLDGANVQCLNAGGQVVKTVPIGPARKFIVNQYTWNGVVALMKLLADQTDSITYNTPTNLNGNSTDDAVLVPDEAIAYLIHMQYQNALTNNSGLAGIDGMPGDGTLQAVFGVEGGKIELMDQVDETAENALELSIDIFDSANVSGSMDIVYDEIRRVVLARNGVFSDKDRITNVVGIRNWDNSNFTNSSGKERIRMNDYLFVLYKNGDAKTVTMTKGTTDPGQVETNGHIHSDQTMELTAGWHQNYQAAGRTGKLLRQQNEDGAVTFKTDTGMNMHKANSSHKLKAYKPTANGWTKESGMEDKDKAQVHTNPLTTEKEEKIYGYIAKLQRTLIGYGKKWGDLAAEKVDVVNEILSDFESELVGYTFYQGKSNCTVDAEKYYDMVEGWVQKTNWSSDPSSGNVDDGFSTGCQVVENTEDFSSMMWDWQQFAFSEDENSKTDQDRWYYTLVDGETLVVPN